MRLRQRIASSLPYQLYKVATEMLALSRESRSDFSRIPSTTFDSSRLDINEALAHGLALLSDSENGASAATPLIPDGTGGVNFGDRRAIYSLIRHFQPKNVLEVGTHVGASTLNIARALSQNASDGHYGQLTTVDIRDVNCPQKKPWENFGCKLAPKDVLEKFNLLSFVDFVTSPSIKFMEETQQRFDFIFLDGDHSATTVYREVPQALRILNPGGVILLHDYFPKCKPLWSNNWIIAGPYLAVQRLRKEGLSVEALPLGALPWPTKLGSSVTSLALLLSKTQAHQEGTEPHRLAV